MLANIFTKNILDRWKGEAIGALTLGLFFWMGMAVYRNIDLSVYTQMPEAFRSLMNIPPDADVGSLAYGAIYASYGALTLAALAISMGSASIAGEERNRTIGLLLGNPKSRTNVVVSKAASMVLLTGLGTMIIWAVGVVVPAVLDVEVGGMHIGALSLHIFVISVFHGFLAMAIGAWTGNGRMASGITATVLFLSFLAVGLFPLISGWANVAKAFPWYYYQSAEPLTNGADWGHLGILFGSIAVLAAVAIVGVNRRDLRGLTVGVTLVDRLRAHPLTKKVADRLAGSTRVSRIWIKTVSEHQGLLIVVAYVMVLLGIMMGPLYTFIDEVVKRLGDSFPEAILALVGGGDMGTPEGFYQVEVYGLMAPIAVMVVTVAIGARALAGEEANRTMGLLLANPIRRSKVVVEKALAMVLPAVVVGFGTWAGTVLGSVFAALDMSPVNIAATCLLVTLLGLAFGALALALSAATGRVRIAIWAPIGVALASHLLNALLPYSESMAGLAKWTPFYYYLTSDPLMNGMNWVHGAVLAGITIVLVVMSVVLFQRRDLRQIG